MFIHTFRLQSLFKYAFCLMITSIFITITVYFSYTFNGAKEVFSINNTYLPVYRVKCTEKKVAITFDCAWGADDIPSILDTLDNADVKASFFIVGQWAKKFPHAIKSISEHGHDICNHSYSHVKMSSVGIQKMRNEIIECDEVLNNISGKNVNLFRAPYGEYNDTVICEAKKLGYTTVQWDVDSLDWKPNMSAGHIMSRVVNKVKPGSIILFHNDTNHTSAVLPVIIKDLQDKQYNIVPVSELLIKDNYKINPNGEQVENS